MPPRPAKLALAGFLGTLALSVTLTRAPAQPPAQPGAAPVAGNEGPEVLARGPVHEAFAASVEQPRAGEIAPKAPPEPIEELPPDQKPEGDNVQWIPGYWDWDEERTDFIWISGFWRVPPPNHVWVPGSWNEVRTGFQWTSGFWQRTIPNQPAQPEIEYLPTPPAPIELGPNIPAPDATSVYVSGSWMWRGRYVWRPGFWIDHRPNWIWVPAHFRWTPIGYVFIDGYWDYPIASRGVLFTPVYFSNRNFAQGYYYTPQYVVAQPVLFGALFVRRGYSSYYFGDYYDNSYSRGGYQPWCASSLRGNFGGGPRRGWYQDPLWSYYSVNQRQDPQWSRNINDTYVGRYDGSIARPSHTLVQQNQVIQKFTNVTNVNNVTNNLTVVNNNITVNNKDVSQLVMVAPLAVTTKLQPETKLQSITAQARQTEAKHAGELRQMAVVRQKSEAEVLKARPAVVTPQPGAAPVPPPQPIKVRIEVPKAAAARAQIIDEKRLPPPSPMVPKIDPKIEAPKVEPKNPPVNPLPKVEPKNPPVNPLPKIEPKNPPVNPLPKVAPKNPPKVDPRPLVEPMPKVDPKPPVNPIPPPRIDPPKPPVNPVPPPKVDPKPPVQPVLPPRVDPPRPPVQPAPPRVDPPRPPVQPAPPRVDPPRPPVQPAPPRVDPPRPPVQPAPPRVDPPRPPVQPAPPRVDPPRPPVQPPRVDPPRPPMNNPPPAPPNGELPGKKNGPPR